MGVHPEILSTLLYAGENVIIRLGEGRGEENIIMKDSNFKQRKGKQQGSIQTVFCADLYVGYTYDRRHTHIILCVCSLLCTRATGGMKTGKGSNLPWKVTDSASGK